MIWFKLYFLISFFLISLILGIYLLLFEINLIIIHKVLAGLFLGVPVTFIIRVFYGEKIIEYYNSPK